MSTEYICRLKCLPYEYDFVSEGTNWIEFELDPPPQGMGSLDLWEKNHINAGTVLKGLLVCLRCSGVLLFSEKKIPLL